MTAHPALALLKLLARWFWTGEMKIRRALGALREKPRWTLVDGCTGCGRCCEEPSLVVHPALWQMPLARALLLWWQRRVNGFELLSQDRESNTLVFRCTHFNPKTRACACYPTRPAMCRDYPHVLLEQPWPELFPECGYRVRAEGAQELARGIEESALPEESKAELRRKLRLE